MKSGNWVAIDKNLSKFFPNGRFSKIEAALSLTIDYDNNSKVTVAGYAKLWGWSRNKVSAFLEQMEVEIIYQDDTQKRRNQKGHIKRHKMDINRKIKGHIRMVDTKAFEGMKDINAKIKRHKKDISKDTTNKPIINLNPNTHENEIIIPLSEKPKIIDALPVDNSEIKNIAFEKWWETYPTRRGKKVGKRLAKIEFLKLDVSEYHELKKATVNYSGEKYPKDGGRFLEDNYWKDWIEDPIVNQNEQPRPRRSTMIN